MHVPSGLVISDKVCVCNRYPYNKFGPIYAYFSKKVDDPPNVTIAIIDNRIIGPLRVCEIQYSRGSGYFVMFDITHTLPFNVIDRSIFAQMNSWAVNDLVLSGCIQESGMLKEGSELVVVTYGSNSTVLLKGGEIYNKITQ